MDQDRNRISSSRKQNRKLKKGRVAIVMLVFIFFIAGITYAFLGRSSPITTLATSFFTKEKINILVLGVDARDDDVGRSDTAFLVTIDTTEKKITSLSIPRDSRVKIEGHGWDKMNHAYAFGGVKLAKNVVENLLSIPVDYTVVMNFQGFVRMIDALGGVTIDVEKRMYYSDPYDDDGGLYIDLHPGVQKLMGKKAIEYVRYRDEEGDIGRVNRQQKFLKALLQELSKPQLISKLPDLIKEFASAVKTDMPTKEMVKLIPIINESVKSGLHTEWLAGTPCWIQEVSYWLVDIKELRSKVAQIEGFPMDERYRQETERIAREYASSVPRETKTVESSTTLAKTTPSLEKETKDSAKTLPNTTTAITEANKQKLVSSTIPSASDNKVTKTANSQSTEVPVDGSGTLHKNTTTDTKK